MVVVSVAGRSTGLLGARCQRSRCRPRALLMERISEVSWRPPVIYSSNPRKPSSTCMSNDTRIPRYDDSNDFQTIMQFISDAMSAASPEAICF
jgi:hypothetical protein